MILIDLYTCIEEHEIGALQKCNRFKKKSHLALGDIVGFSIISKIDMYVHTYILEH